MTFRIADDVDLPSDAATQTFAFLARRGAGKTYAAGVLVESFLDHRVQVVVVDPVGTWWGLRLAADGVSLGIPVPVFGGLRGDIPLEPTAGAVVARLVAEQRLSVVLDVSMFTGGEQRRFVTDFARELFDLKKSNKSPVHLVFDEAQEFFPQNVDAGAAPMVGAVLKLWKIGRNFGIGGTLISQRPQEVNKSALNLTECLVTGQLTGPQERKTIAAWVTDQGMNRSVLDELPALPIGTVYLWSPQWMARLVKTRFLPKRTFDASATPKAGAGLAEVDGMDLKPINLDAVRAAMALTIERAEEEDPKKLRARIKSLEGILKTVPRAEDTAQLAALARERDQAVAVEAEAKARCVAAERRAAELAARLSEVAKLAGAHLARAAFDYLPNDPIPEMQLPPAGVMYGSADGKPPATDFFWDNTDKSLRGPGSVAPRGDFKITRTSAAAKVARAPDASGLKAGALRMLRALASRAPTPLAISQIGVLAVIRTGGGSFGTYLSNLKTRGFIDRAGPGIWGITPAGLKALGPSRYQPGPSELVAMWSSSLKSGARRMLAALVRGQEMTKAQLSEASGIATTGGSFDTYLSRLRSAHLVERSAHGYRAVPEVVG